jgi:hypothetical protein
MLNSDPALAASPEPAPLAVLELLGVPEVEVETTTPLAFFTVVVTVPSALRVTVVVSAPLLLPPPPPPAALVPEVPLAPDVALVAEVELAALVDDAADVDVLVVAAERLGVVTLAMAPILLMLVPRQCVRNWEAESARKLNEGLT